jgi:hypothetical protein
MPKKRKYKPSVGDIFVVPLSKKRYAFARIINIADGWDLAEVFAKTRTTPEWDETVRASAVLYPPVSVDLTDLERGLLKTVAQTPGYEAPYLGRLRFVNGTPGQFTWIRVNAFHCGGRLSDAEAAKLPEQAFYALEGLVARIKEILTANVPVSTVK